MPAQRHIIKRQVLELTAPSEQSASRLQEQFSRIYRSRLVPIIDRHCNQLSSSDRVHRIDSLELDLGAVDAEHLERDLIDCFTRALAQALPEQIRQQEGEAARQGTNARAESQLELLAVFARTGTLPWWADASNPRLLQETLEHLIEHAPQALTRLMRELARSHALQRIIRHYDDQMLGELARALAPISREGVTDLRQQLLDVLRTAAPTADGRERELRIAFWQGMLLAATERPEASREASTLCQEVLMHVASRLNVAYSDLVRDLSAAAEANADPAFREIIAEVLDNRIERSAPPGTDPPDDNGDLAARSARPQPTTCEAANIDSSFSEADQIYIDNAGLVILSPFLPRFFGQVGLLEENEFIDHAARHRAAGLLAYIATKDRAPAEYTLPLCKLLCGMELTEVFDFGPDVSDAEAEHCIDLLNAVIEHASVLGKISVDGFCGSFLLREGVLSSRDGAWLLRVERKTFDIVLDRLPWTYQWIKLPWMEETLRVEW